MLSRNLFCIACSVIVHFSFGQLEINYEELPARDDWTFEDPDNVLFARDIVYDDIEPDRQAFDIFIPQSETPVPAVIYLHGGGFVSSNGRSVAYGLADDFVNEDVAMITMGYRILMEAGEETEGVLKCLMDAKRGLQFVRHYAEELNIDPNRISVYGGSAGASIAWWLAAHDDMADPDSEDLIARESTRVCAAGLRSTQGSLDFVRWHDTIFGEFKDLITLNEFVDFFIRLHGLDYFEQIYGGASVDELLNDPFWISYRNTIDFFSHISADDPPIYVNNGSELVDLIDVYQNEEETMDILHYPYHAERIYHYSDSLGIEEIKALIPEMGINTTEEESRQEFVIRYIVNSAPVLVDTTIAIPENIQDDIEIFSANAFDEEDDFLIYEIVGGNEDGIFNLTADGDLFIIDNTGIDFELIEEYRLVIEVTEDRYCGAVAIQSEITIAIEDVNEAPQISQLNDQVIYETEPFAIKIPAIDQDNNDNNLTFSIDSASSAQNMTIDSKTGTLSWTPGEDQDGEYSVTVTVTDGELFDSQTIIVHVIEINSPPVLSPIEELIQINEFEELRIALESTDIDIPVDDLMYSIDSKILTGMQLDAETGVFTWTPTELQEGIHPVLFKVSDGILSDTELVTVEVVEVNQAPVTTRSIDDIFTYEGFEFIDIDIAGLFIDPDEHSLILRAYSLNNSIASVELNGQLLRIDEIDIGTTQIVIEAEDEYQSVTNIEFTLTIEEVLGVESSENALLYPNPFDDQLNIELPKNVGDLVHVIITDLSGNVVVEHHSNKQVSTESYSIPTQWLTPGIYFITLETNKGHTLRSKILK